MFEHFIPNFIFDKFDDVTPEFLKAEGISFLLIDIDNTLAPYEEPLPNERVKAWFAALDAAGIRAILVSNNHADRVELFNSQLGLPAFADCHKPSPRRMRRLMESFGATLEETSALGDQIFTDVWGAKAMGARAILVPPIRDKKTLFFRAKRLLEKPFLRVYRKRHGG
jgi:HAD superfamily phosphatase (TIGR01668 family)